MKYLHFIVALLLILPSCQTYHSDTTKDGKPLNSIEKKTLDEFSGTVRIYCCVEQNGALYTVSGGSGFFVDYRGKTYLSTATHVIEGDMPYDEIKVVLTDASVITFKPEDFKRSKYNYDVAVAKVDRVKGQRYFKLDVNNSEGYDRFGSYLVVGYVSAKYPTVFHGKGHGYVFVKGFAYILTDHAINYGVSGSALLDHKGRVIGITSMKTTGNSGFAGAMFVPVKYLIDIIDHM